MIPFRLLLTLGRIGLNAAAPAIMDAAATKIGGMNGSRQQQELANLINIAAGANELVNRTRRMADPSYGKDVRLAMIRHQKSFDDLDDRAARLIREKEAVQKDADA